MATHTRCDSFSTTKADRGEKVELQKQEREERAVRRAERRAHQQEDEQSRATEGKKRNEAPSIVVAKKRDRATYQIRRRSLVDKSRKDSFPLEEKLPLEEELIGQQELLSKLEQYTERYRIKNNFLQLEQYPEDILQVKDMSKEYIMEEVAKYEQESANFRPYLVPSRSPSNIRVDSGRKRYVFKKRRLIVRNPNSQKYLATHTVMSFIMNLCKLDITADIRHIYYSNRELFKSTENVSAIIDDICCMIGCTRSSLRVEACEKGVVIGNISLRDGAGVVHNGNDGGKGGVLIPPMTNDVTIMAAGSDALFILIVEKHTVWIRLAEDEFHKNYRCIMITAKGMPDVNSRRFVNQVSYELKIPVHSLNDFNPYGMKIASVFRFGSKNMSYDGQNLATPCVRLLGILHKHLEKYPLPPNVKMKMNHHDRKIAKRLLETDHLDDLDEELKFMLKTGTKIELEAFGAFSVQYMSRVFLHLELQSLCDEEGLIHEICEDIEAKCNI